MNATPRALLVYGYEPSGHSAAANAIEEAGLRAGLSFFRVEIAGDHHPSAGLGVARAYHGLLRKAPALYGALYHGAWARGILKVVRSAYLDLGGARRLSEGVRRSGADVVVCPQAAVAAVLSEARRRGELDVPVVSVLTDYGVHPFWTEPAADLILAPSEAALEEFASRGIPRSRLRATGIPVDPAFAALPSREEARRSLALPPAAPVALLSGGGKGLGAIARKAKELLDSSPRAQLLVLCGANEGLRAALSTYRDAGGRLRVFGPQPPAFVARLMAAADLHLGKPGGLTSAESLAAGLPMILTSPLPGQEEANARHLLSVGAALEGGVEAAVSVFRDRARLKALSVSAGAAGIPHAAESVALAIREVTERSLVRPAALGNGRVDGAEPVAER